MGPGSVGKPWPCAPDSTYFRLCKACGPCPHPNSSVGIESSQHGAGDPLYLGPTSTDLATFALKNPKNKNPNVPKKLNLSLPGAKLCVQPHASSDVWACPVISWTLSVSRAPYVSLAPTV